MVSSSQAPIPFTRSVPMSRCRTHGSNGDSQASILDSSSGARWLKVVVLKEFVVLKELSLLLKARDIFDFRHCEC